MDAGSGTAGQGASGEQCVADECVQVLHTAAGQSWDAVGPEWAAVAGEGMHVTGSLLCCLPGKGGVSLTGGSESKEGVSACHRGRLSSSQDLLGLCLG